ncbi:hypothetical protein [Mycetocola reblochoni]|uniref:Uncharacterized protein n=2 Tax=Mycetocola reblochoni TaxID=331618 RepID=A0A1R4JMH8_9MICO|nr:hypothetical protein [Mycetocola reblochoni]RLP68575.1 hypothetical protein D9V30_09885 [Mycetocola reblochoni]SJN33134.1 hypothetical protein FM119_08265 [Mycetocola reblochoni REB411]
MIINARPTLPLSTPVVRWRQSADDVYAATLHDEFAGYITVTGAGYELRGPTAEDLGTHPSRQEAEEALDAALSRPVATTAVPSPSTTPRSRPRRRTRRSRVRS